MFISREPLNHELSKLFNQLWDADVNRFVPGKDYTISLQGKAGFVQQGSNIARDSASEPLFHNVNEQRLKNTKTYSTFVSLLDNYEASTGMAELVTSEETAENNRFLDAVLETEVMKIALQYLVGKNWTKPDLKNFKSQLYDIWFHLYSRERGNGPDSCGFEHVFVGETKRGHEILGLHNWVQFYLQEKLKHIDYKGYVARQNKSRPDEDDQVLSLQFSWKGLVKPVGSSFIGVSPEFEFALYTIIFLQSNERVTRQRVRIEEYELEIVVYRHGRYIGTAYPVLLSSNNEDLY
ncbi:poly(U)-specific endoribonuclease-A isoform X2 [Anolis carolinensis]|uniref:poly(U)-specific endoribonuclease-A isoform X2 n=1 Tax=Anolis carolinensis TaxID=28377 RepID=UPI000462DFE1|nr:PREDICTED: poly(U)-specific endoribonuclease-A isoform X1 [Anolis carolinensis]|eukprot:XP_008109644.1 PREDICTED: poly(U)-specific endoribonuclease-A isoform X1 [Anolis carolinensis]